MSNAAESLSAPVSLVGCTGMLGRVFLDELRHQKVPVRALDRGRCDLTDSHCADAIDTPIVINCAAWTDVDGAEDHEDEARRVNAGPGLEAICRRVRELDGLLVHFSTDYVFDGSRDGAYPTDHPRAPINAYGRTKAAGEELIEASGCRYLIVRTSWLYAPWGRNFVRTIADLCRTRPSLRVVDDQWGRPTSCRHLARATLDLVRADAEGIFHVCDGGACSWYEFACRIRDLTASSCRVEPCTSEEYPRPAARPRNSVLDLSETESLIGPLGDWREHLASVLEEMQRTPMGAQERQA